MHVGECELKENGRNKQFSEKWIYAADQIHGCFTKGQILFIRDCVLIIVPSLKGIAGHLISEGQPGVLSMIMPNRPVRDQREYPTV